MASVPNSSTRSGPEKGQWDRCSVSHSQLTKLQTQRFLPPIDLVPVRAGLDSFNGEIQAEDFPNPSGGESMFRPLPAKGRWISHSSVPLRASGILWPPAAQLHPYFHSTHYGLRCLMWTIPGHRGSLRAMEEVILPCPAQSRGVHI